MAEGTEKKKSPIAKLLPLVLGVIVVLGAAGGGTFVGMKMLAPAPASAASGEEEPAKAAASEKPKGPGLMLTMKERVVNLAEPTAVGPKYLKFAAVIEFKPPADFYTKAKDEQKKEQETFVKGMGNTLSIVEDTVVMAISAKKASELTTPDGREKLKADLIAKLEKSVKYPQAINIYFTEFVMQ